jgi:hypothetical protein
MASVPLPITSRHDFQLALDEALVKIGELVRHAPKFQPYQEIEIQLDAMKRWTANGREPTEDERKSINIGLTIIRELDPQPDLDMYERQELFKACHHYFRQWPADGDPPYS